MPVELGGRDDDIERWREAAAGLENLHFHGFVSPPRVEAYRQAVDVLLAPAQEHISWSAVRSSLKRVWPGLILIGIVLGGLWGGVFSPTEAGGMGAFAAFIIMLVKRGFSPKHFIEGLKETTKTTAMIFTILIGATIFGYFMTGRPLAVMK